MSGKIIWFQVCKKTYLCTVCSVFHNLVLSISSSKRKCSWYLHYIICLTALRENIKWPTNLKKSASVWCSKLSCLSELSWEFTTILCSSEISYNIVCCQNKSLGNWQGDQRMTSVIWRVVCLLERFPRKSLHFPGSNIKSYSARPAIFFGFSSKQEFGKSPVVNLIRICWVTARQF